MNANEGADRADGLPGLARSAGRPVGVLALAGVRDKDGFMDRCAEALELPEWFGRNWDALADSLTDSPALTGSGAGPGPAKAPALLWITGWQGYAEADPQQWRIAQEVLAEAAGERLEVVLSLG